MVKNIEGKSFNFLAQVPSPMFVAHESITNKVVNYKNNRKVILKRTKRKSRLTQTKGNQEVINAKF